MSSTRQVLQAVSRQIHGLFLLCEAGRTACCSLMLLSGSPALLLPANISPSPHSPWQGAQLGFCFSLPAAPAPRLWSLGLRGATAAPHHSGGTLLPQLSPPHAPWAATSTVVCPQGSADTNLPCPTGYGSWVKQQTGNRNSS